MSGAHKLLALVLAHSMNLCGLLLACIEVLRVALIIKVLLCALFLFLSLLVEIGRWSTTLIHACVV